MAPKRPDPWAKVEDVDGSRLYRLLQIKQSASPADVRKAYRALARVHHPDKPTGDAARFAEIQEAFEVLSDPQAREAYDVWARQVQYRYIPGVTPRAPGGEDLMLDELERLGLHVEPSRHLVVICEVCGRPSTRECYACTLRYCDFCVRKPHWKGRVGLHYPAHNDPGSIERMLAERQTEDKRIADGKRLMLENPNYRTEVELREIREFKEAAAEVLSRGHAEALKTYDPRLAKYYMWAQTARHVYVAVYVPTGYADRQLQFRLAARVMLLQPQDSPPVIQRVLAGELAEDAPVETFRSEDRRLFMVVATKRTAGEAWERLFDGDPWGARALEPPYTLTEGDADATLEVPLPFWTEAGEVHVRVEESGVTLRVPGRPPLARTFWRDAEHARRGEFRAVDVPACTWALRDDVDADGERCKVLMLVLVRPPPTHEEVTWKKGVRQNNRVAERTDSEKGWRFFADDEDEFGLEDVLQALCFLDAGSAWVPAKPWRAHCDVSVRATKLSQLSEAAQKHAALLLDKLEEAAEEGDGAGDDDVVA